MATKIENDLPPSPTNDESDGEEAVGDNTDEANDSVARILKQLQSNGALIKKPKEEYHCYTCEEDFQARGQFHRHLLQHVSLPSIILEKLPSDDELDLSGDEHWSDEDDLPDTPAKAPQKIDVSQLLKQKGIQIKAPVTPTKTADSALSKLSGLGFTIKKNVTPIKQEKADDKPAGKDIMQKLGMLGGIKLKIKSDGGNSNFKVVNGLRDFQTSDNEDEDEPKDSDEDPDKSQDASGGEGSGDEDVTQKTNNRKNSDSDDSIDKIPLANSKRIQIGNAKNNTHAELVEPKAEPADLPKPGLIRRAVKQTPKRGTNILPGTQIRPQQVSEPRAATPQAPAPAAAPVAPPATPAAAPAPQDIVVKQEVTDSDHTQPSNAPLFSGQIKTERSSPPITDVISTPLISRVKSESEPEPVTPNAQPLFTNNTPAAPLLPKTESSNVTIIEINGDSNDEDDDCCVVSSTPAPDIKPTIIPKTENTPYSTSSYPTLHSTLTAAAPAAGRPLATTEKQHSFNWNAPDTKPPIDMLERSADDIFESLLSSTKKEGGSLSDTSEYISLDRLGSQHACDVCNSRYTTAGALDDHIRATGHSASVVLPSAPYAGALVPASSSLLTSLLPVKQLAEQVGKLSAIGTGASPYATHQQNVMINIQAYPGAGGMPPPAYPSSYPQQGYPPGGGMYQQQQYPPQYMNQQQQYAQYQPPMSKAGYPGAAPGPYVSVASSSPYSAASPLQGMQQAVYGQAPMMSQPPQMGMVGQMGPPSAPSPGNPYAQATSPGGAMRPPPPPGPSASGIRIQNVQTFSPGQLGAPGGPAAGGAPRGAGPRPRAPGVRGARPTIRPGIQVQGQARGPRPAAPRAPLKRPGGGAGGPQQKRRDMLLPGKHDNEDCHVMAMQKQREGMPLIHSVQGAKDKLSLGSQISITKKSVPKPSNAMAHMLASRGISIKQKPRSRSPSPERPAPRLPSLPAGMSIRHAPRASSFSIPEAGGGLHSCKLCRKSFMSAASLSAHAQAAHPQSKLPVFKCDECPASYPKSLQLQHHKRTFHNVTGPNRELGLPVVDLSQPDNVQRLSNLGIYHYIPLASRENADGSYGIPVVSVSNMHNGLATSIQALGADGLLSLGPLKQA
ncbi:hypothetical protein JYU34_015224 [Plutella xylostella]|uniref:C2H2-type domain-containing protein n=1 Tax=Plutella xylostella TaxID=51655 RepID=A0ABQ7Q6L7_PLUXY|nr:hypothetical protein JYU34_015224 [Plutella xylostella]